MASLSTLVSSGDPQSYPNHPHLRNVGPGTTQLFVDGKPFLILGGELHNSSLSSAHYMAEHWARLRDKGHINTLLGSITWEAIEPVEGAFDFAELDKVVLDARQHGLRLVLLWFGSYKNGMSTYVPRWIKTDHKRFPRCHVLKAGGVKQTVEAVSPFSCEVLDADARAFSVLMTHIRELDEEHSTVIMVQVENEPGLLGDSRDRSAVANQEFEKPVPVELLKYLASSSTHIAFQERFRAIPDGGQHSWEDVFGKGTPANEAFMAHHISKFVSHVAAAGKRAYPLPMYTNAWLNADRTSYGKVPQSGGGGGAGAVSGGISAGSYPSGGAVPHMLDIWRHNCEAVLDFFSPDIYTSDYLLCLRDYQIAHSSNILFVPEQRRDAYGCRRLWPAYARGALGCSPFGIDTADFGVVDREYKLLSQIQHLLLTTTPRDRLGFFFDEEHEVRMEQERGGGPSPEIWVHRLGSVEVCVRRAFVFGKTGPGGGMIIHLGGLKFIVAGYGFNVTFSDPSHDATFVGLLSVIEKQALASGELATLRLLNGDETRAGNSVNMPNENPDYGNNPIPVTIPARTGLAEVEIYMLYESSADI
ncbi:hypothetical protein Sste5346_006311 [Sporothrix stenoceras]|uniref:Glycoside hydrolase family 35 protein n=1 Tax=Sporothrix stenoceras TaxID=5173 RepID=A0ABR3YYN7_9PEZI